MQRILMVHNRYRWFGGEDAVVDAQIDLLKRHGHEVLLHETNNADTLSMGRFALVKALLHSHWRHDRKDEFHQVIRDFKPEIVHAHNLWFNLTPSVLAASHEEGVPVVLSIHNMRLLSPCGVFLDTEGLHCKHCASGFAWRGIIRRCYHNSFFASFCAAKMSAFHRKRGTWHNNVDLFLSPSDYVKRVYADSGFPEKQIQVLPHAVADPGADVGVTFPDCRRLVYIGRFSVEKGLFCLLNAWKQVRKKYPDAELLLAGDGGLKEELMQYAEGIGVRFCGILPPEELARTIASAGALVLASECAETFGRVVIEAAACARASIVPDLGGPPELVEQGQTGFVFRHGDSENLAACIQAAFSDPEKLMQMGRAARALFERNYTEDAYYLQLLDCYQSAATYFLSR